MKSSKDESSRSTTITTSQFVRCPICQCNVIETFINDHIDRNCSNVSSPPPKKKQKLVVTPVPVPPSPSTLNNPSPSPSPTNNNNNTNNNALFQKMMTNANKKPSKIFFSVSFSSTSNTFSYSFDEHNSPNNDTPLMHSMQNLCTIDMKKDDAVLCLRTNMNFRDHNNSNSNSSSKPKPQNPYANVSNTPIDHCKNFLTEILTTSRLSVPTLKSILQKNVRRRRPLPAARVAIELMFKSMIDFLRRFTIIIVEDSLLHPDFGLILFLQIAMEKNCLPGDRATAKFIVTHLVRIVEETARCKFQDVLSAQPAASAGKVDDAALSFRTATTVVTKSLLLRERYGGMGGDMKMLRSFALLFEERFSIENNTSNKYLAIALHNVSPQVESEPCSDASLTPEFDLDAEPQPNSWTSLIRYCHSHKDDAVNGLLLYARTSKIKLSLNDIVYAGIGERAASRN